jgi:hypothetical protein
VPIAFYNTDRAEDNAEKEFGKSVEAPKIVHAVGYGMEENGLSEINLVYKYAEYASKTTEKAIRRSTGTGHCTASDAISKLKQPSGRKYFCFFLADTPRWLDVYKNVRHGLQQQFTLLPCR